MQKVYDIPLKPGPISEKLSEHLAMPVHPRAIRDAITEGRIRHIQIGRSRYTSWDDVMEFAASCVVDPKVPA